MLLCLFLKGVKYDMIKYAAKEAVQRDMRLTFEF